MGYRRKRIKVKRVPKYNPHAGRMGYSTAFVSHGNVTWQQLVDEALSHTTFERGAGEGVVIQLTDLFTDYLHSGYAVEIRGLGTFRLQAKTPWTATPQEQHKADVQASIRFEPCQELKRYLRHPMVQWTGKLIFPSDRDEDEP